MEHVFRLLVAQRFQLAFGGRIVGMLQQGVFCLCNRQGAVDGLLEDVAVDATHKMMWAQPEVSAAAPTRVMGVLCRGE